MNTNNDLKNGKKMTQKNGNNREDKTRNDLIPIIDYCDLMTSDEVCNYLKISKETLYKWIENGKIPYYRITEKKRLFNRKHICQWLNEKMVG